MNGHHTVELPRAGYGRRHEIEILDYHVRGWVLARCLTHGTVDIAMDRGAIEKTATGAAEGCRRKIMLPAAPSPHSLRPLLVDRGDGNGWVRRDEVPR